ncbi:MAG: hypothetical protein HY842_05690 [Bacteroidetes bacterium]|nr:hypothetical protein [Bacteroidota bacterium]
MVEIDDIIELKTNTETERLSFATRYIVQINFTFDLTVLANGFGGASHFCVRRDQIETMCVDLTYMHLTLSGKATLEDNDSDAFVRFEIESNGRLNIRGQVGGSHEDNFVKFAFQTDQTCIPIFVNDFKSLINKTKPKDLYTEIDEILWNDWDPIGINGIAPRDEYQSYTPTIFKLKTTGADKETIAKTLHEIETVTIGVAGSIENCRKIAAKIINLK